MAAKALNHQMTRMVKVDRLKLLETLTTNRAKHLADFNDAMDGYKEMAHGKIKEAFEGLEERLRERRKDMVKHVDSFTAATASKFQDYLVILEQVVVNLKVPVSYVDAYDVAIDMVQCDVRPELELSGAEFQCFHRDVWDWTHEFTHLNAVYSSKAR